MMDSGSNSHFGDQIELYSANSYFWLWKFWFSLMSLRLMGNRVAKSLI